jgi:hypothetical protein
MAKGLALIVSKAKKAQKFDCIDDFLRKNFEMILKNSSENTPFLNC